MIKAHDVRAALDDLPELAITSRTTEEDAAVAMRTWTPFNSVRSGRCASQGRRRGNVIQTVTSCSTFLREKWRSPY